MNYIYNQTLRKTAIVVLIVCGCRHSTNDQEVVVNSKDNSSQHFVSSDSNETFASATQEVDVRSGLTKSALTVKSLVVLRDSDCGAESCQPNDSVFETPSSLRLHKTLDYSSFPNVAGAEGVRVLENGLAYETAADFDMTVAAVSDELVKLGFVEQESYRTEAASLGFEVEQQLTSLTLSSSLSGDTTSVRMFRPEGVDTSDVPVLEARGSIDERPGQVYYKSPVSIKAGLEILQSGLKKNGLDITQVRTSEGVVKVFKKEAIAVVAAVDSIEHTSFDEAHSSSTRKRNAVYLTTRGATELEKLPVPHHLQQTPQEYARIFGSIKYVTEASPIETMRQASRLLQEKGWRKIDYFRKPVGDLEQVLIKNGEKIQIRTTKFDNGRVYVDYILSIIPFDIPNELKPRVIRLDRTAPRMFLSTAAKLEEVRGYYVDLLPKLGWELERSKQISTSDRFAQLYKGRYYRPIILEIQNRGPETTWLDIRPIHQDEMIDQIFEIKPEHQNAGVTTAAQTTDESFLEPIQDPAQQQDSEYSSQDSDNGQPNGQLAAAKFPIPMDAKNVKRDFQMIAFRVAEISRNVVFLQDRLKRLGWKPFGEQIVESEVAMLKFQKGSATIDVSLTQDNREPSVYVVAYGDGLWFPEKDGFSGAELVIEEDILGQDAVKDDFSGEFAISEFEGMPLPNSFEPPIQSGTRFRSVMTSSSDGELSTIHNFFIDAAPTSDWGIQSQQLNESDSQIRLVSQRGELLIELQKAEGNIKIQLVFRNSKRAKEQGLVPPSGKARLILVNASRVDATIIIGGKPYKLEPGRGAKNPREAMSLDIEPGVL